MLPIRRDFFVVVRSANDGQQGDEQPIEEVVFFTSVKPKVGHLGQERCPVHATKVWAEPQAPYLYAFNLSNHQLQPFILFGGFSKFN